MENAQHVLKRVLVVLLVVGMLMVGFSFDVPDIAEGSSPTMYALSTVASPPAGGSITRFPNTASYPAGTVVTLTAKANPGYQFDYWYDSASGTSNLTTITLDRDKTVTAVFQHTPVLLVHGFQPNPPFDPYVIWGPMAKYLSGYPADSDNFSCGTVESSSHTLESSSHTFYQLEWRPNKDTSFPTGIYISNYTGQRRPATLLTLYSIESYSEKLKDEIDSIKANIKCNQVDIVAHSMGGLISRRYIEASNFRGDNSLSYDLDVNRLIMVATPNGGTSFGVLNALTGGAPFVPNTVCGREMDPFSSFLKKLNGGDAADRKAARHGVEYTTFTGYGTSKSVSTTLLVSGDSVVDPWSARLPDVPNVNVYSTNHSDIINASKTPNVAAAVAALLAGRKVSSLNDRIVVTFNRNGGTTYPSPKSINVLYGSAVTLPVPPTRTNYSFTGWNMKSSGAGMAFTGATTVTSSISVYAQWRPTQRTVTFNRNTGMTYPVPASIKIAYGSMVNLPVPPTKTGYTFLGWNTKSTGTGTAFTVATQVVSNITVYAQWRPNRCTVTFSSNGGTASSSPRTMTVAYGSFVSILPVSPKKTGYTFTGWNMKANGTGTSYSGTTPVTANITVYAQWRPNQCTVTFNRNGGTSYPSPTSIRVPYGSTVGEMAQMPIPPTRTGYTFTGWNMKANGTGWPFTADIVPLVNTTVYAQWKKN